MGFSFFFLSAVDLSIYLKDTATKSLPDNGRSCLSFFKVKQFAW